MSPTLPENLKNRCLLRFLASHMIHLSYLLFRLLVPTSRKPLVRVSPLFAFKNVELLKKTGNKSPYLAIFVHVF